MSLVGSLEDLSLGDILQIISLSQKSGVLALQTTGCDGRIVFVQGLVRGAAIKGGHQDLRGVLVGGGFLSVDAFEAARRHAEAEGVSMAEAVAATTSLSSERIDSLCREAIESAVITMFSWNSGDFSFDVRTEAEAGDPEQILPTGINAQYLAMESARLGDEGGLDASAEAPGEQPGSADVPAPESLDDDAGFDGMNAEDLFCSTPPEAAPSSPPEPEAVESLAAATIHKLESDSEPISIDAFLAESEAALSLVEGRARSARAGSVEGGSSSDLLDAQVIEESQPDEPIAPEEIIEAEPIVLEHAEADGDPAMVPEEPASASQVVAPPRASQAANPRPASGEGGSPSGPIVVIDNDLLALEWVKAAFKDDFSPIHIFQHSDQGLARIRQYLVRGQNPVVLISPQAHVDPLSGFRDAADFLMRLKKQSSRLTAFWLLEDGGDAPAAMGPAEGAITRPERNQLRRGQSAGQLDEMARAIVADLRARLAAAAGEGVAASREDGSISPDALRRLRDATKALTEASSRGEVLPLVIRFAAEIFSRVAMFMVRDGVAIGMAQHGLELCGGPDDQGIRALEYDVASSEWMTQVLSTRKSVSGPPAASGDRKLSELLGNRLPASAYLAPIETAGQAIALLYGDNLPADGPIGDTSALEVVLHHAGLALDRAALERALAESEG